MTDPPAPPDVPPLRVVVQGRGSTGRLDAVTGLVTALRRSGHRVLHLDDAEDLPSAQTALRRLRPHLLLRVGRRPGLTERDLDLLRSHGMLALGWQVDVPGRDGPGDATGARLDLLASAGITRCGDDALHVPDGVFWLPVGVDRSVVEQQRVTNRGARRDVLLLGHATAREDVHALAHGLADAFSTAAYGPGWPTAWRGSPDGAHLLEVLQDGHVHVHVSPGTVAMLSLAVAGTLAAPRGSAVAEQLTRTGVGEQVELCDVGDAVDRIGALLGDTERLRAARAAGRRQVLQAHTYEHRWGALVAELERRARSDELHDPALVTQVLQRARDERGWRRGRVVVSGWYGARNAGDELILEALAQRVEGDLPDTDVVVAARYPHAVLADHGLEAFDRTHRRACEQEASRATAVLLGGGGLWEDYTFARNHGVAGLVTDAVASVTGLAVLPLLADVHARPVHVVGMGVGPLTAPGARAVVRHVAALAHSVTVRDAGSREELLAIPGWKAPVAVAPDVVYSLRPHHRPPPRVSRPAGRPLIGVNLRRWGDEAADLEGALQALRAVAQERDAVLVGLPLSPQDAARLAAVLPGTGVEHVLLPPAVTDLGQLLSDLAACDAVVSMRLHGCLLAHRAGTPVIGLGYDPKVVAHFTELGRDRFVVPLTAGADSLIPLLHDALDAGLPGTTTAVVTRLEEQATTALRTLTASLAEVEAPPEPALEVPWLGDDVPGRARLGLFRGDVSGSSARPGRRPPVLAAMAGEELVMSFGGRDLQAGDVVAWSALVPAAGGGSGRRVELTLRSPNLEDRSARGRLAWQVRANDRVLVSEDVAAWKEEVSVWVGWGTAAGDVHLEVRVVALSDCRGTSWRRASGLHLRPPVATTWDEGAHLPAGAWIASCSSPGAAVLT